MDKNTLAHTTWNCKYHIVFAPKYRRQVIYGKLKGEIGKILRMLCERKGVEIIEANACPDHIHMLLSIPPKYSVSEFIDSMDMLGFLRIRAWNARKAKKKAAPKPGYIDTVWPSLKP